jgi:hypothetical protein
MTYSPFKEVPVSDLRGADLEQLSEVPEGWFIEYKRAPCSAKDYAKEVSAFANSQGGWIFVGLGEDPSTKLPTAGPGIVSSDALRLRDAARDAIMQNLSPPPHVEFRVVDGPISSLRVSENHSVLVIHVPESRDTPHIHSSGKIYRRQADAAQPIRDRAELDTLVARRTELWNLVDEQLNIGFEERWGDEIPVPWIHIALVPDPVRGPDATLMMFDKFQEILREPAGIQLPDVYPSALGFAARNHSQQEAPHGAATTLEYAQGGAFYITLPLSVGGMSTAEPAAFLDGPSGVRFTTLLHRKGYEQATVIDGTALASCLFCMAQHMGRILKEVGGPERYLARIRMRNVFRRVPFFDAASYIDWCERNTVPVIHRDRFQIPWPQKRWQTIDKIGDREAVFQILVDVFRAFGVDHRILGSVVAEGMQASRLSPSSRIR